MKISIAACKDAPVAEFDRGLGSHAWGQAIVQKRKSQQNLNAVRDNRSGGTSVMRTA